MSEFKYSFDTFESQMTLEEVNLWVNHIVNIKDDDESAHSSEDHLYTSILESIADGRCTDPVHCAKEALRTKEIDFSRWCA